MDLSKLPKLSQTDRPPNDAPAAGGAAGPEPQQYAPVEQRLDYGREAPGGAGPEVWFNLVIGALLLYVSRRLLEYVFARGTFSWTFQDKAGAPLPYPQSAFFWADLGVAAFAVALIADGLAAAFARRRVVLQAAFGLMLVATLANVYAMAVTTNEIGFQIMNALSAAFGVYVAMVQWRRLQASRPHGAAGA